MATIALVDDDRDILALVATMLESEGYHVVAYPDGPAALNAFKTVQPDLAILDIKMPQMDGVELLRRLRQKSDVPVIFLTGRLDETDELLGLRIGLGGNDRQAAPREHLGDAGAHGAEPDHPDRPNPHNATLPSRAAKPRTRLRPGTRTNVGPALR